MHPFKPDEYTLSLEAPAKLNLFLHINRQRPDGYHELQTVFQLLDRGDTLHFSARDDAEINLSPAFEGLRCEDNLIYRAALKLREHCGIKLGANIYIEKRLPAGGGVGGGSSDAATTLLGLNYLWNCGLSLDQLAEIGLTLGADVPVFVRGHSAFAEGIGENLQPIELVENWFVVLRPNCHVSTAEIFSNQLLTRDTPKIKIAPASEGQDFGHYRNDCEAVATKLYSEIRDTINWLNQFGNGRLTGTGACCFCSVESKTKAEQILNEAQSKFEGFIAKGVNLSPAHEGLMKLKGLQ